MIPYIVIPIFTDTNLHPLHIDNQLSLLYVKELDSEPEILTFNHVDSLSDGSFDSLKDKTLLTPNKKHLLSIYPFKDIYDASLLNYFLYNVPLDFDGIRVNTIDVFNNRYYGIRHINAAIPIYKHLEYCDQVAERLIEVWNKREDVDWDSYEQYNKDAILAFYSIERNGVAVSNDVVDIFDKRVEKHLSGGKLYSDYFLCTSTGRPSNSFGSINFAALDENKRKAIIPENDMLVEFDYDAFHVRLIGDIIGYKFPDGSAHEYLAQYYEKDMSYEESKQKTFQYLYGMIPPEVAQLNPYFGKVSDLTDILWSEFKSKGFIETPIYKRKMLASNLQDMNKNKLLNYVIQASETEHNIKTIISLQQYLYMKRTKLVLYGYDSFLLDISNEDGNETLNDIKNILEQDKFLTKSKQGMNYGF